jgi:hypothetical protein
MGFSIDGCNVCEVRISPRFFMKQIASLTVTRTRCSTFGHGPGLRQFPVGRRSCGCARAIASSPENGKQANVVAAAIARELAGFVWAIARRVPNATRAELHPG